jgi:hypothetical protein
LLDESRKEECAAYNTKQEGFYWIGHILRRNCHLKDIINGKIQRRIEVIGRRGRKSQQLLDYLREKRGYWKTKEEAVDGSC